MSWATSMSIPMSCIIVIFIRVENELLTLPDHLRLPPVLVGFVLLICVVFIVDHCMAICSFSFGNCVVCPSSIYGF